MGSVKASWEALSTTLLCYRYALSCLPRQRGLQQDSSHTVHNHPPVAYLQYELTSINKPFKFHTAHKTDATALTAQVILSPLVKSKFSKCLVNDL